MKIKGGMVVPTITVFKEDESFDEERTWGYVDFMKKIQNDGGKYGA